ncbi:hypothetical protein EVAR_32489_1 [Eumeta japonica]|uniref:Uncharacterized protein n=1 Tax=Eumeta variegata TaxID=151549 RepID=A0A4C1W7V1_EUMVA|nr:hypothetical protein EVAR_32489_1 [Eumeta japonica]
MPLMPEQNSNTRGDIIAYEISLHLSIIPPITNSAAPAPVHRVQKAARFVDAFSLQLIRFTITKEVHTTSETSVRFSCATILVEPFGFDRIRAPIDI